MWSSRLFWKLFLGYAALNLVATITIVTIVARSQRDSVVGQLEDRLRDSVALLASQMSGELAGGRTQQLQDLVRELGSRVDSRITLISMDGEVLADSGLSSLQEVAGMENHKDRVELVQAAKLGQGMSERLSPTLGERMLYVARRVDLDGRPAGMVRAALPMSQVNNEIAAVQNAIWLVGGLISVAVVSLTYFLAARVVRPVVSLTRATEAIAAGDYRQHVYFDSNDEIGVLARSFNRMNNELLSRETQLRESGQRLTTVLEGMAEGIISLDDRQRIVLANAAAGTLLGFSPSAARGRPLMEVVRNHLLHDALVGSQQSQEAQRLEIEVNNGEPRVLSVHATLAPQESKTRFILVIQDITELRRLESMRQEFVANVSHELKTPLSSIKAYAETLGQGAINDSRNNLRFVYRIEEQAERLHQLILDLLSLARIESGQQAFEIAAINVEKTVLACLAEHQANAEQQGVALLTEHAADNLKVRADEEGTRQIINNLINNAINYTPAGGRVTVSWRKDKSFVLIEVSDTGIGIAKEHLPRLFERFYRVDKARSRELGGTGLGLSIVKHLTQSFGGTIEVQSEPGVGTSFFVRLPLT